MLYASNCGTQAIAFVGCDMPLGRLLLDRPKAKHRFRKIIIIAINRWLSVSYE